MLGEMPCFFDLEQKSVTIWIFNSNRTEEVKKAFYSFICLTYEFVKSSRDTRSFYGRANMATWDWKKIGLLKVIPISRGLQIATVGEVDKFLS